jgi:hypothetical protein
MGEGLIIESIQVAYYFVLNKCIGIISGLWHLIKNVIYISLNKRFCI